MPQDPPTKHVVQWGSATLLNPAWLEWNEATWGCTAVRLAVDPTGNGVPSLRVVYYRDRRGRVYQPPANPHIPLVLRLTPTDKPWRLTSQWLELGRRLAEVLAGERFAGGLALPPGILDGRPLQVPGLLGLTAYTYVLRFPYLVSQSSSSVRKNIHKAHERGYRAERSDDWAKVVECLRATSVRKGFRHRLDAHSLAEGQRRMGDEYFRGYLVRGPAGEPVAGGVRLHEAGETAVDWLQGADHRYLTHGVNQLMYSFVIDDLTQAGSLGLDLCGANIPEVAKAKSQWGVELAPYIRLVPITDLIKDEIKHRYRTVG